MRHSHRHFIAAYTSLLSILALVFIAPSEGNGSTLRLLQSQVLGLPSSLLASAARGTSRTQEERIAQRLQYRLYRTGRTVPPLGILSSAILQRQDYLRRSVKTHINDAAGNEVAEVTVSLHSNPLLLVPEFSFTHAAYHIDMDALQSYLQNLQISGVVPPQNITISKIEKRDDVLRAETTGLAKGGKQIAAASGAALIAQELESGGGEIDLTLVSVPGSIRNESAEHLGELTLLATGRSNFAGSTYARSQNVRKALRTHVNNTVVPPGETFSFNSTLGGPVTETRGWYLSQVIYEGDQLRPAPGGGICQASTTVYRAIVYAGFPVVERRAHSLYVSYYKEYGVGIDATIYPGYQDLVFLNDTEHPLLIQAYDDGSDAIVNIYGTPDGRHVDLDGPYFSTNAPEDFRIENRTILSTEIAWVQRIHYPDGTVQKNFILSRYKTLPDSVKREYASTSV